MEKQKNGELSRMFGYAGKFHVLTVLGCVLSGISTILSMLPFVCIWLVIRDLIQAFAAGDISLATGSAHYAWMAVVFAAASILIYFIALNCTHLAAFRTATNMRKSAIHHIVTLPLGYFSQNASGRLRNIIDDNAGLTEGFLAHQLPDLTGAAVMPVAVIILIFLFDWRLGICCLIPMGISVIFLKQMMGGDNAQFMGKYMTALETMNKEAVEYIRGIPVVKVFQQTIYSFKNFHAAIEEYEKFASGYALKCRIPLTGFTVTLNGTFVLLIPVAMFILSGVSGQAAYENVVLDFLFYSLFTPVCATMMNRIMFASEQLMVKKCPDLERGESASETGRDHIPPRVFKEMTRLTKQKAKLEELLSGVNAFNAKGKAAEIGVFLGKYIPAVEQMHTTLKKYNTAFTVTTAENKKLKKKTEQLEQSLDKATQESTLKKLADAKLHRDYEDAVAVLDCIPKEVLAAYTHRTEKERETAYGR